MKRMTRWIGWLLGIDNATAIDEVDASLAAPWAQDGPFWVFLGAAALVDRGRDVVVP